MHALTSEDQGRIAHLGSSLWWPTHLYPYGLLERDFTTPPSFWSGLLERGFTTPPCDRLLGVGLVAVYIPETTPFWSGLFERDLTTPACGVLLELIAP